MTLKVLDTHGNWRPLGDILPPPPDPSDLRGVAITFHGRYRGAHNTGVPNKSALGLPEFAATFATPNETISDRHFIGGMQVTATGVIFERCSFDGRGDLYVFSTTVLVTLYDCDIFGGKTRSNADVTTGSIRAVRCHIWGGGNDCVGFGDGASYEDCYIHTPYPHYGTHSDIAQTLGGTNLTMLRSKLMAYDAFTGLSDGYNSAMQLGTVAPTPLDNLQIVDNYVDGGGYTFNGNLTNPLVTNTFISGNRWGRHFAYGPIVGEDKVVPPHGTYTATNVFDDTGIPV